jgi:hypothetical protein
VTVTANLLASLEAITFETIQMLATLDTAGEEVRTEDRTEAKRRVTLIRDEAQTLLDAAPSEFQGQLVSELDGHGRFVVVS